MQLEAKNICKSFGNNRVLDNFSYIFPGGRTTVVMGPSGCGKSTLLSILMKTLDPDSGDVLPQEKFRRSAVFQENRLCENLTAIANIRLVTGKKLDIKDIEKALSSVGLVDVGTKLVKELSGGMKRRVALLRALLTDYDVLFLDEPFKGLDSDTKSVVMEYVKKATTGKTVIMVTHDRDECDHLADNVIML